jgi:hypothetical protein
MRLPVDREAKEFWDKVDPWIEEIEIILKGIKDDHAWHITDGLRVTTSLRFKNIVRACDKAREEIGDREAMERV